MSAAAAPPARRRRQHAANRRGAREYLMLGRTMTSGSSFRWRLDAKTVDDPVDARRDAADLPDGVGALLDQLDQIAHGGGEIAHRREDLIDAGILLPDRRRDLAHGPGI